MREEGVIANSKNLLMGPRAPSPAMSASARTVRDIVNQEGKQTLWRTLRARAPAVPRTSRSAGAPPQ